MSKLNDQNSLEPKYLREDISQECKELISTLPTESPWLKSYLHQYQGFWMVTGLIQGVLSCQKHFQDLNTDVLVVTVPKSGTTWLKALTFTLLNRKRYSDFHKHHPLLTNNPHVLVPFLALDLFSDKDSIPTLNSFSSPRLFSTHMPHALMPKSVKESKSKVIYLCRDPKDTFVSHWHFANKLRPEGRETEGPTLEELFDKFCRGVSPFGPIWDHVLGYWKESLEKPDKILFLRYEEMKMQPFSHLKKIADFLEYPFSEEEESTGMVNDILNLCSFENLSNLEVNKTGKIMCGIENKHFFRRGQVGDSKNLLTSEMIEQLNTITKKKFGEHGLSF